MLTAPPKKLKSVEEEAEYLAGKLANVVAEYTRMNKEVDDDVVKTLFRMLIVEYAECAPHAFLAKDFMMDEHDGARLAHELDVTHETRETLEGAVRTYGVLNVITVLRKAGKKDPSDRLLKVVADIARSERIDPNELST